MTISLKYCPFCGNKEVVLDEDIVFCSICPASVNAIAWQERTGEKIFKEAIQKMLNGIEFSLDESFSRRTITMRLKECRGEAIRILKGERK